MKKTIALLALLLVLSLTACGGDKTPRDELDTDLGDGQEDTLPGEDGEDGEETPSTVMSNDIMEIKAICVDDSYEEEEGSPLKMVYLLYTLTANNDNLKIDSKYTNMTINDTNSYESDHFANAASANEYMPNYTYTSYIQDVYVGSSIDMMATFKIPEGDLAPGRTVSLSDTQIPGVEELRFTTDEVQHFSSGEELAQAIDPEGYALQMAAYEEADAETTQTVRNLINGYYWSFYVNSMSYELEFWADNNFEVRVKIGAAGTSNAGTYSVRNKYIFLQYPDMDEPSVKIPYEIVDGDINLKTVAGFDVMG